MAGGAGSTVGSVARIRRFPVKSMTGETIDEAEVSAEGIAGDRAYALIDVATGRPASAKDVRHFGGLLRCGAAFLEPPGPGRPCPPVRVTLPDGTTVSSDAKECDRVLSAFLGREVSLARCDDPSRRALARPGAFFDLHPVTVLTTSTIAHLARSAPGVDFDERRFRMNVTIDTQADGPIENAWMGRSLRIGDAIRIEIAQPDERCVMTTLPLADLPGDGGVLKALALHNGLPVGEADGARVPCAGVYAIVRTPGHLRAGDPVHLD